MAIDEVAAQDLSDEIMEQIDKFIAPEKMSAEDALEVLEIIESDLASRIIGLKADIDN